MFSHTRAEPGDNRLAEPCRLIIGLGMVGGCCQMSDAKIFTDGCEEHRAELRSIISQCMQWGTIRDDPVDNSHGLDVRARYFSDGNLLC